jgi:hypothetical protein
MLPKAAPIPQDAQANKIASTPSQGNMFTLSSEVKLGMI